MSFEAGDKDKPKSYTAIASELADVSGEISGTFQLIAEAYSHLKGSFDASQQWRAASSDIDGNYRRMQEFLKRLDQLAEEGQRQAAEQEKKHRRVEVAALGLAAAGGIVVGVALRFL